MHSANFSSLLAPRRLSVLPLAGAVALLAAMIPAGQASAATSGCTTSGSQVTCIFTETGGAQTWTVPTGVTQATFTLYGAQGSGTALTCAGVVRCKAATIGGGLGAKVTATLPVAAGTALQVNVGQVGIDKSAESFGGGGPGTSPAGGGGGASDVRTPGSDGTYPLANRLLVAGGGGGAGAGSGTGGDADSPGQAGNSVSNSGATLGGGAGGGAGTSSGPGAGGAGGTVTGTSTCNTPPVPGTAGTSGGTGTSQGTGGSGGSGTDVVAEVSGGGGGGGYYGGGGGGSGSGSGALGTCTAYAAGGGGGGGSSYTGAATSASISDGVAAPDDAPDGEVIITYTV